MDITGVDSAVFGVEDLAAARQFLKDYGMREVEHGAAGASFEALDGSGVELRLAADSSLPVPPVKGATARETIWGVRNKDVLEKIGAELSKDRQIRRDPDGMLHTIDDEGLALGFWVTRRHTYKAEPKPFNVSGLPPARAINSRVSFKDPGRRAR